VKEQNLHLNTKLFMDCEEKSKFLVKGNATGVQRREVDDMLYHNKEFVDSRAYEPFAASKYPDKKVAIVTCMDTRLVQLLPAALGIKNGDVIIIKNGRNR
jgi:hypothetical protein